MKNCIVSIVSGNYLAYARVLAESLYSTNQNFEFKVLIVDKKNAETEQAVSESGLDVMYADDLLLPDLARLCYKYDIVELNTALKPTFLKKILSMGYDNVIYLDPDIQIFSALLPVMEALEFSNIVLTPHALSATMDGMRPSDVDFLRGGAYNLGFIALKNSIEAYAMLNWWEERCLGMGFNDQVFGIFVDQKWIDLVPCYFSNVGILRHPGCNVAYWNLHERTLNKKNNFIFVGDQPLIFFHFSGIVPDDPSIVSRHQNRHQLEQGSSLHELIKTYCGSLKRLGHAKYSEISYGFAKLSDGTQITPTMRRALLVMDFQENEPFNTSSLLQRQLAAAGLSMRKQRSDKALNTLTFDPKNFKVRLANLLIRLTYKLIGLDRLIDILRYLSLLMRESHLAAVLLDKPFDLAHRLRR